MQWVPPPQMATKQWLGEHFHLPAEAGESSRGPFNVDFVPYFWGIWHALDDDAVGVIGMQKAAQIGWTYSLVGFLGKRIHTRPSGMIVLFPTETSARDFSDEKFSPAVMASPVLNQLMDVRTTRKNSNRVLRKSFPGGFAKFVRSNSIADVKSTPAALVVIEEPDDTSENVKSQGDAIRLVKERLKRQSRSKLIIGGTPSVEGLSRVEEQTKLGTQRVLPITCHDCGESHVLDWENVSWIDRESGQPHPIFRMADPESAVYVCPHCGSAWDDWTRKNNVLGTCRAAHDAGDPYCGWVPTVDPETTGGVETFREISELYVCMPGTTLADVVRDYLEAEHDAEQGDESGRVVFANSKLGRPYSYQSDAPQTDILRERALDYREMSVPDGGLIVVAGVDVQHDRLAILIDAYGRDEESWTIYAGEIYGNTLLKTDPVWDGLDKMLFQVFQAESGLALRVSAISIDSSDGVTSDAVYAWVRAHMNRAGVQVMAVKGSSSDYGQLEIFSRPKTSIDTKGRGNTKASRYGLKPYIVGTHKAKDLISGRMKLEGHGPGRWHWYRDIRADFYDQITGEVKAPHRSIRGRMKWQQKAGQSIEFWDCKVYALHASRAAKVHLMKPAQWDNLEAFLQQQDLFSESTEEKPQKNAEKADLQPVRAGTSPRRSMGFRERLKR